MGELKLSWQQGRFKEPGKESRVLVAEESPKVAVVTPMEQKQQLHNSHDSWSKSLLGWTG